MSSFRRSATDPTCDEYVIELIELLDVVSKMMQKPANWLVRASKGFSVTGHSWPSENGPL
jgi:hypothetical protein